MASKVLDFLEALQQEHAAIAADVAELATLYQKKLWHQLTVKVEECFSKAEFNKGDIPFRLYENFISDFAHKINLLKLSQFAVHVSKHLPSKEQALKFLQQVRTKLQESKLSRSAEPLLFLHMHIAQAQLELGQLQDAKGTIESGHDELQTMSSVDPSVSAAVFYVKSLYHKLKKEYTDFYKSSLMYLSYVSSDSLAYDFKLSLAVDVSLAALLGENLYNFAQLLMHPIVNVLDASPYKWLHELLECFNKGDLFKYDELCKKHAAVLNSQPALVENERMLRQKVTISCLIELISSLPPEERTIPLQVIAERTKLTVDGVEFLLMKALALHLIEGSIDQVAGKVQVSWVQPQVLTKQRIEGLKDRLDTWLGKVTQVSSTLEQETIGMVEVA